jgi:hypothetical protein
MSTTVTISRALANKIVYVLNCKKSFTQGGEVWSDTEVLGVLNALRAEMELKQTPLTDEEREAIEDAVAELTPGAIADTLRKLLERMT